METYRPIATSLTRPKLFQIMYGNPNPTPNVPAAVAVTVSVLNAATDLQMFVKYVGIITGLRVGRPWNGKGVEYTCQEYRNYC